MKEIYEMKGAGRSIRGIAQELDVSRNTVRRKPYKLMTVSALAELYVLWREGKASPEQVESLLLEGDSYLNMDRVARLGGGQM